MNGRRGEPRGRTQVAVVERKGRFLAAQPLFERGSQIALDKGARSLAGRIALIEFGPGRARVVRSLGRPDRARDVVEALLWERLERRGFGNAIEDEGAEAADRVKADPRPRRDLTALPTFTVDPASARDFDDAVSAERAGDGVRLWIHIADVAAHVRPGSGLDREAYRRANSTYVPGTVESMLPEALSADACSLAPGVERLAVTVEVELSARGEPRRPVFYRSLIRSDARLDYDQLDEIFASRAEAQANVGEPLASARAAAARGASAADPGRSRSTRGSPSSASTRRGTRPAPAGSSRRRPTA